MIAKIKERLFSRQFLNLLMIKMLIPAMATGGMSVEVGAHNPFYMLMNSETSAEISVIETAGIDTSIEHTVVMAAPAYQTNMADDSSSVIRLGNVALAAGANQVSLIEQTRSGYAEPEIKLPDLTFT